MHVCNLKYNILGHLPTDIQMPYLTESCIVLQICSMALRMTGSLVGSTWFLRETNVFLNISKKESHIIVNLYLEVHI